MVVKYPATHNTCNHPHLDFAYYYQKQSISPQIKINSTKRYTRADLAILQ